MEPGTRRYSLNASVIGMDHLRSHARDTAYAAMLHMNLERSIIPQDLTFKVKPQKGELDGDYVSLPEVPESMDGDDGTDNFTTSQQMISSSLSLKDPIQFEKSQIEASKSESRLGSVNGKETRRKGIKRLPQLMAKYSIRT